MADLSSTFKNVSFLLRLVNLILALVCFIIFCVADHHENGMRHLNFSEQTLYSFTVPCYLVILLVLVVTQLFDEEHGKLTLRLVLIAGAVLFAVTGIVAIINYCGDGDCVFLICVKKGDAAIFTGILCVIIAVLMVIDILKTEECF